MAAENESPAREPTTRGRGRGGRGRGGRGRGGGRGGSSAALAKSSAIKPGRGGSRRGRAKNFSDSRVQAAYERQRDLKATYQAVAHALKPALQELAERTIDEALQQPDLYKQADESFPVFQQLQANLDKKIAECDGRLRRDLDLAENTFNAESHVTEHEFQNGFEDVVEQFDESQENRLRILNALCAKGLPVDIRDDQYEYKVITDEELDKDFGIYECYKDGHLVPYPSRVEGTEMWQRVRDADAAVAATVTSAPTRGRGRGRGGIKRRAQGDADGQPTPKKSTRLLQESQFIAAPSMAPAPAKGLLASAAEVEENPEGTPGDEESAPASPEPPNLNGASAAQSRGQARLLAREKSPQLPKSIAEPDDYGFRIYNQRPSLKEKGINSRLLAPHLFWYEDWEIGFRDSVNDSTKGHTRVKRGKYLDTPNSNGMHFDHWCNGYDFSNTRPEEFDRDLVKLHNIHPKYGIFLPSSNNELEDPDPYVMPGKPVVYIANPSGRISHASRSFQSTINHNRAEEAPLRQKLGSSMRRFCKMADIGSEEIALAEYLESHEELQSKSLGTAVEELESRPKIEETPSETEEPVVADEPTAEQPEGGISGLSVLTYATAYVEAQEVTRMPATPKPARYDAIRDVFTDSKPAAPPAPGPSSLGLNFLAELCNVETRVSGAAGQVEPMSNAAAPVVPESDMRSTIKHEDVPPAAPYTHAPPPPPVSYGDSMHGYPQHPPMDRHPQPQPQTHPGPGPDHHGYMGHQEHGMSQPPPMRNNDYRQHAPPPPPPPPGPDQGVYFPQSAYPISEHRDIHMQPTRGADPGYNHGRLSYPNEPPPPAPSYGRVYWPQHGVLAPAPPPQHYPPPPPPPPSHSRIPFAHSASAEPLPPLRPPRGRNQSMAEEPSHDGAMRASVSGNMSPYYPPAPSRSYHRSYPGPDAHGQLQPIVTDRILPNPQQPGQSYMGSPSQGYAPQLLSPTFGNPQLMANHMAQSPPGTPQGPPGSAHRHRSTPSGSSDAGSNKYRKLQPAPVPAHRAWSNKPELKTIPYDHKETGSSAALPSSGPTQIRGWNVNQPRKRSKAEKERAESVNERDDSR